MKNKKKNRTIRLLLKAVPVLAVGALVAAALAPQPVPADIESIRRGPLMVTLDHEGKTRVRNRYVISAPLAGRVHRIELEPGDPVTANQTTLVTFEPRDPDLLDTRSRAELAARVKAAESTLDRTEAEHKRLAAELRFNESELRRTEELALAGIVSESVLESARSVVAVGREALLAAESAIAAARFELEAARARLVEPGSPGFGDRNSGGGIIRLRSPVSGVVLRRLRESEAIVPEGEALLEVADPADLEVVADFLSADAVRMVPGMATIIDRWGGEAPLRGRVRRIEPAGFMKISALGVEEQRVNVIIDFDDPHVAWKALGDDYRVEVRVVVWESEDALLAPTSSLFRNGNAWAVFVVADRKATRREVTIGHRNGLAAEILDGLAAGDRVIAYPSGDIADGVEIVERADS